MMTKYEKFFDGLSRGMQAALGIMIIFLGGFVYHILSGKAMTNTQFFIFVGVIGTGFAVLVLWIVCYIIGEALERRHKG